MINKLLDIIVEPFKKIYCDAVITSFDKKLSTNMWKRAFEDAMNNTNFFAKGVGNNLALRRGILRFYFATFNESHIKVSVENLAISIGMELKSLFITIDPNYIYDLAEAILTNWYTLLNSNSYLREKYLRRIEMIDYKKETSMIENTLNTLETKDDLYRAYFKSYNCKNSSTKIRVWLPRPDETWIRWEKQNSIIICVNPMLGFELGFFRIGFDYSDISHKTRGYLNRVYYSNSSYRESAVFSTIRIGKPFGKTIWAS